MRPCQSAAKEEEGVFWWDWRISPQVEAMLFSLWALVVLLTFVVFDYHQASPQAQGVVQTVETVTAAGNGTIAEILVTEGQSVKQGQVLMRMRGGDYTNSTPLITAPQAGVVSELWHLRGDQIERGETLLAIRH